MFKFPLKRHHNNNQNHHKKSSSSRINEGFIYIRCAHNNCNNNNNSNSSNNKVNNLSSLSPNNNNEISVNNSDNNNKNNIVPEYVARSTVQSSWRPQLPLPNEINLSNDNVQRNQFHNLQSDNDDVNIDIIEINDSDMERFHLGGSTKKDTSINGSQVSNSSHNASSSNKKWFFGRLFRRKKEIETESSSEEDVKAGFLPIAKNNSQNLFSSTPNKKTKPSKSTSRGNKLNTTNTCNNKSHNLHTSSVQQQDNEFFLPVEILPSQEPFYQNNPHVQVPNIQPQARLHHSQQYLPHAPQTQQQLMHRSALSLDRRSSRAKLRCVQKVAQNGITTPAVIGSSSEEEIISLNSTTFSKYRSDESIHSGGQGPVNGQSRRSRAARNERYYKRLSRDGEVSHGQVPVLCAQQPVQRWKTQPVPLSIYQAPKQQTPQQPQPQVRSPTLQNGQYTRLRNTNSLQHMAPYVQWGQIQQPHEPKNLQNSVNNTKRSISYDSHIHLQNTSGKLQNKPMPPPPPPRDPLRKVHINSHLQDGSSGDLRPMSYAFDHTGVPILPTAGLNGRCVSDDKIWAQQPHYQSIHSLNIIPNQVSQQMKSASNRRFITRAERDAQPGKKSLPNGLDFHYVADATPRSRKPIHMLEPDTFENDINEPKSSGILRTTKSGLPSSPTKPKATEFWKRLEGSVQKINTPIPAPRGRDIQRSIGMNGSTKPRSVSSSRAGELTNYSVPMYAEVYKPKSKPTPLNNGNLATTTESDAVDGVIFGSLRIKPTQESCNSFIVAGNQVEDKIQSMPNAYHRRSGEIPATCNKYEEYVNERREQHHNPLFDGAPQPPLRKPTCVPQIPQLSFPRKKPANLEEAIFELEAIYRSLGLSEEPEVKQERVPTPNDFEKYALAHADEYDEEDSPAGEPDPVRDDVAYRNIKLANLQHKTTEKQPPFGIPLGPIVPAAQTDYLHVSPKCREIIAYEIKAPDVIKDDLAVRALRKDPAENKTRIQYSTDNLIKKNRATRTQSANIYALIQRDAAKPSGGDLHSYLELSKSIDRSGSMSDIHKNDSANDIPTTLKLLQSLREQDLEQNQNQVKKAQIPFRHPSRGGAICQLPEKLNASSYEDEKPTKPIPMPRKSLTPEPQNIDTHKMEEALNKIAQDAQESSIKLTQELKELRKEALITASKPKKTNCEEDRLEKELHEIEKVSQAAKKCGEMLLDALPDAVSPEEVDAIKPRKLHKEDTLIKAIDQVSEAANKVCEKILKDMVSTNPPAVVQEMVKVSQKPTDGKLLSKEENLVMPSLIKKLDPENSTNIEAIARRCMRQLSDLADNHDYDNVNQQDMAVAATSCNMQQVTKDETANDLTTSNLTEIRKPPTSNKAKQQKIEEIDQIMKECEDQAKQKQNVPQQGVANVITQQQQTHNAKAAGSSTTASSFSSSSDCLAKSSSPSGSRRFSSSVTSFNPYSSSDYIKSPSSEFHAPSTDPIKTFSTTSYDVQSTTSATPNLTTVSTYSYSPSPPPLNLTPISNCSATIASNTQRGQSSSPLQYNSSEELAMIFGIEEKSKTQKLQNNSGKNDVPELLNEQEQLNTNAESLPECTANPAKYQCCAKTNDCLLLLNPCPYATHATNNASCITPMSITAASLSSPSSKLKFSTQQLPNELFNSKLSINMSQVREKNSLNQTVGQLEPLSCLEENETSSNPDSGNVSLADFPLGQQNISVSSVQLNSNYNTRFEFRNSFKSEITIATPEEFPRLPTAEELENSLRENHKKTENVLIEQNILKEKFALAKEDYELMGERIIWARDEIMAEVKALEEKSLIEKNKKSKEKCLIEQSCKDEEALKLLNNNEALGFEETDGMVKNSKRKRSIIRETPQLEMHIMEERINYEFNINTKKKQQEEKDKEKDNDNIKAINLNKQLHKENALKEDELVSTSCQACLPHAVVNAFGEQRTAAHGFTLLEQLVVACTLGVINTNDLVTLCLIITGILIVIAIALF